MDELTVRDKAYALLEEAINKFTEYVEGQWVPVDAVLLIGFQRVDDEGDRVGHTTIFPRHGSQPSYSTIGLLSNAKMLLDKRIKSEDDDDE